VIRTGEVAAVHFAERELELPVCATVLERAQPAVLSAIKRDRPFPELDLDNLARPQRAIVFHRVPIIGVHAGGARFLPAVVRILETRGGGWMAVAFRHGPPWARCKGVPPACAGSAPDTAGAVRPRKWN